jgi:hypothetical protein
MYDEDMLGYADEDLPAIEDGEKTAENGSCGDRVAVRSLDPPEIAVEGCLVCRAAAAKTVELCEQDSPDRVADLDADAFLEGLSWELSPAREDCALTVLRALRQA